MYQPGTLPVRRTQVYHIVQTLFSAHPVRVDDGGVHDAEDSPFTSIIKLEESDISIKTKKAPGPDDSPTEVYKLVFQEIIFLFWEACPDYQR